MIFSIFTTGGWFVWFMFLTFYFVPSLIAFNKRNFAQVFALNMFLGWTFVGWVVSLVMSLKNE